MFPLWAVKYFQLQFVLFLGAVSEHGRMVNGERRLGGFHEEFCVLCRRPVIGQRASRGLSGGLGFGVFFRNRILFYKFSYL